MDDATAHHDKHVAAVDDAAALQNLGHKQELKRNFSRISMLGLAFAILNTWTALSASITLALPSGGPSAVIWGLMVAGVCNLCLAFSLAEFLSAYPTAGGQYHWAALVSWPSYSRGLSYVTGWINVAGWVALSATGPLLASTFIINIITFMHPDYESKAWQQFLLYILFTIMALTINAFATRLLPLLNQAAFLWSMAGFVIISITVIATAAPNYQTGKFVYGDFINDVGWPDGMSWLLGLLQGAFALTGFDAVAHMIEEIPNAREEGPKIMIYCIGIGMFSGFVFLSCLLFVLKDLDTVLGAAAGPLLQIFFDATGSKAGAVCLLMFPLLCMCFTTTALFTTSARMTYAFSRDRGLPFSHIWATYNTRLDVPLNALFWTTGWVVVFGLILLGSSSTFNAITAASVVALGITYAIPPAINLMRGGNMLPESRPFMLSTPVRWICNLVGIAWSVLTTVLFVFPPELPVTSSNMNYCIVAFGVILLIAITTWFVDGRAHYKGPLIHLSDMEGVEEDTAVDTDSTPNNESAKPQPHITLATSKAGLQPQQLGRIGLAKCLATALTTVLTIAPNADESSRRKRFRSRLCAELALGAGFTCGADSVKPAKIRSHDDVKNKVRSQTQETTLYQYPRVQQRATALRFISFDFHTRSVTRYSTSSHDPSIPPQVSIMSRYAATHVNPQGPGDARPTALQIIKDEGLEGNMKDKVFIVTGCSSGLGIETGRALAATGAKVFLAVRSMNKGEAACAEFLEPGRVELLELDTSSLASVRAAAAKFLDKSSTLNVLICNAGVMMVPTLELTEDGFESQIATNYLGHFLFFWLLKDTMAKSSSPSFKSRLVNVSSSGHHMSEIEYDDINLKHNGAYDPSKAYGQSKLAQIYMANYVDRHFSSQGIHALSLMPGGILTGLSKHVSEETMKTWTGNPDTFATFKNAEQGSATTVLAAVSKEWEDKGGKYLENCQVAGPEITFTLRGVQDYTYDEAKEDRLWKLTLDLLKIGQ
ncbi:hypothetical protein G7046_g3096 [Stylonectria norvegica]|nr:hypothetical protein G7046_g3096 [Stylonectria norvegica]